MIEKMKLKKMFCQGRKKMYFKNLNLKDKPSLLNSMNLTNENINTFVTKINDEIIAKDSKSLVLLGLDNMSKQEMKCFCFLSMVGYEKWKDRKSVV